MFIFFPGWFEMNAWGVGSGPVVKMGGMKAFGRVSDGSGI